MKQPSAIWQPELVRGLPFAGKRRAAHLKRCIAAARADRTPDPSISVVIRARNERGPLEALLQDLQRQEYSGSVELIVVDNESTDGTIELAKRHGAKVVTIARGEFTYPRSMNIGVSAATNELVFLTVAHTRFTSAQVLHAAARHFAAAKVGGAFAVPLPGKTARFNERLVVGLFADWRGAAKSITRPRMSVLGATDACIRKSVWEQLGHFDERFERGGEDTHLAAAMLKAGYRIINEPAMAVYHDHGGTLWANIALVWQAFLTLHKPQRATAQFLAQKQKHLSSE